MVLFPFRNAGETAREGRSSPQNNSAQFTNTNATNTSTLYNSTTQQQQVLPSENRVPGIRRDGHPPTSVDVHPSGHSVTIDLRPSSSGGGGAGGAGRLSQQPAHHHQSHNPFNVSSSSSTSATTTRNAPGIDPRLFLPTSIFTPFNASWRGEVSRSPSTAPPRETPHARNLTSQSAWPVQSCPPFSPEDIVSTFEIVSAAVLVDSALRAEAVTATAGVRGGAEGTAPALSSVASRDEVECAICLERLFRCSKRAVEERNVGVVPPQERRESGPLDSTGTSGNASRHENPTERGAERGRGEANQASSAQPAGDVVREVYCGHRFHEACILLWIRNTHYTCPLCRAPLIYE